jgi:EAL domain-containing protein (putative c-di-GMP-specific phosphodiesterase class I)
VVSVEVLPRWQHPERGLLMPEEFVPTAASSGLASELARYLLGSAITACTGWRVTGCDLGVSVNLPSRAFADTSLPETVARLLESSGLPADKLTLEIAESNVVTDDTKTLPGLRQLSALGVRVAVDGFGTGHASLSYLRRMPIRQVKIDAGFVRRIDHDSSDEAIVRSIVELGAKLGLDVVAEGVDRQAVWDQLRRMGCGQAQGALLVRPLPLAGFAEWLAGDDPVPRRLLAGRRLSVGGPRESIDVDARDPLRGQAS